MTQKIVIYHRDCTDGFTAAWVAWLKFGDTAVYLDTTYGEDPPNVHNCDVWIVDFSYPREVLEKMHTEAKSLRVFDHHKTAEAALKGLDYCVFDMHRSGAGITWDELFADTPRPELINYVEDRDLWTWGLENSREINAYIGVQEKAFTEWQELHQRIEDLRGVGEREAVIREGAAVLQAEECIIAAARRHAFMLNLFGELVPCVSTLPGRTLHSELVGALAESAPYALGVSMLDKETFKYSLRSRGGGHDVSVLAKMFGGGGHRNAASFTSRLTPNDLEQIHHNRPNPWPELL